MCMIKTQLTAPIAAKAMHYTWGKNFIAIPSRLQDRLVLSSCASLSLQIMDPPVATGSY